MISIERTLPLVLPKLAEYLKIIGHIPDRYGMFICPNPEHNDTNASAHILPSGDKAYCFGCGQTFNILDVAKWHNETNDAEEALAHVCETLGVEPVPTWPKKEMYKAAEYVSMLITKELKHAIQTKSIPYSVYDYFRQKQMEMDKLPEYGVGIVSSYEEYEHAITNMFDRDMLDGMGLLDKSVFGKGNIVFTIYNEDGLAVGFAARRFRQQGPKYKNTKTTDIYRKASVLYGIHEAKDHLNGSKTLIVTEGYADALAIWLKGRKNAVALGGTAFTQEHYDLIQRIGTKNVVFMLDGDEAGKETAEKIAVRYFLDSPLNAWIAHLPNGKDPDEIIAEKGIAALKKLPMTHVLELVADNMSPEDLMELAYGDDQRAGVIIKLLKQRNIHATKREVLAMSKNAELKRKLQHAAHTVAELKQRIEYLESLLK